MSNYALFNYVTLLLKTFSQKIGCWSNLQKFWGPTKNLPDDCPTTARQLPQGKFKQGQNWGVRIP